MAAPPADLPFDARAVLAEEARRLSAAARAVGLDAPVAHLTGWGVREVVAHTGGVHRWAIRVIEARSLDVPGISRAELDDDALLDHFDEGAAALAAALAAADPEATIPNFHPGTPPRLRFWWRRQAHETTVHRWDVEAADPAGAHAPIDDAVALDGIDELLVGFATRGKGHALEAPVTVASADRGWRMAPSTDAPGRLTAERLDGGAPPADAGLSGPPTSVLLALWKRLPADHPDLRVAGAGARTFLAGPLTP